MPWFGAEILINIDYTDRGTCVLFGDGAGAAVVARSMKVREFWRLGLDRTDDTRATLLARVDAPSAECRHRPLESFFKMKATSYSRSPCDRCPKSPEVLSEAGEADDVKIFIPHQANQRITDAVAKS